MMTITMTIITIYLIRFGSNRKPNNGLNKTYFPFGITTGKPPAWSGGRSCRDQCLGQRRHAWPLGHSSPEDSLLQAWGSWLQAPDTDPVGGPSGGVGPQAVAGGAGEAMLQEQPSANSRHTRVYTYPSPRPSRRTPL